MILKYQDIDGFWHWVDDITDITFLGFADQDKEFEYDTLVDTADTDSPSYFRYRVGDKVVLHIADVKQAFLCNSQTGSTVDVLVKNG